MTMVRRGVVVEPAILRAAYEVDGKWYRTVTERGRITTVALTDRFMGGDNPSEIAADYGLTDEHDVLNAIRWEMLPRSTRLRRVRKAVGR